MPSHRHAAAIAAVAAALLTGAATTTRARSAPDAAAGSLEVSAPAAAPASGPPDRFAVNHGVCKDFLSLAPDLRGLVVAWTAGRYHKLDRWVLDETMARKVIAGVERACEETPEALFRYKVVGEVDKLK